MTTNDKGEILCWLYVYKNNQQRTVLNKNNKRSKIEDVTKSAINGIIIIKKINKDIKILYTETKLTQNEKKDDEFDNDDIIFEFIDTEEFREFELEYPKLLQDYKDKASFQKYIDDKNLFIGV